MIECVENLDFTMCVAEFVNNDTVSMRLLK